MATCGLSSYGVASAGSGDDAGRCQDILLFSDLNLLLAHHYRVHKRGLPHIAFWKDYMSRLRALLPVLVVLPSDTVSPPVELRDESPRQTS